MIGTWMVANVRFVIIPGQRELVAAKLAGRDPDPRPGVRGKQRSVHNNYLTLPVVIAMLSTHFSVAHIPTYGWLVLLALMAIGAWVRHFFNLRHQGRVEWWIPITAALAVVGVAWASAPRAQTSGPGAATASFSQVQPIIAQRCAPCHAPGAHATRVHRGTAGRAARNTRADRGPRPADQSAGRADHTRCHWAMPLE